MSSKLSARAINLSLALRKCDYWPKTDDEKLCRNLQMLYLDEVAQNGHRFLKRRLILQNFLKDEDVQDIFTLGEPLIFDAEDCPRLVVPKIVEAFQHLTTEPSFLDVSIVVLMKEGWANEITARMDRPAELWSQVYDGYLPCAACTMVEVGKTSCHGHFDSWPISACDYCNKPWTPLNSWASYAVEKFHVASKHFDKQLDVELYFTFGDPAQGVYAVGDVHGNPPTAPKEEKLGLLKVAIRLVDGVCGGSAKAVARKSTSVLLISDFALEVYGFVDRVHAGASLVANRGLNEQIVKLRHLLPVHHLMCAFEQEKVESEMDASNGTFEHRLTAHYWMVLHYFRRDLPYSEVRRFKIPSAAGSETTAADCALILRYLSNSHVEDFKTPTNQPSFSVQMLAALVDRNVSMGQLRLRVMDDPLVAYPSLDAVFRSGMRLDALSLWIHEDYLQRLINTADFFRMPLVQRLKELKLILVHRESSTQRQRAVISSPLWAAGIYLLRNCALFRIDLERAFPGNDGDRRARQVASVPSERDLESIALKLAQTCEKFEQGEVSETVEHFVCNFPRRVAFPFKDRNMMASGVWFATEGPCSLNNCYSWDVYRFRNAATGEWLTACVWHSRYACSPCSMHIMKGEFYPDAPYDPKN